MVTDHLKTQNEANSLALLWPCSLIKSIKREWEETERECENLGIFPINRGLEKNTTYNGMESKMFSG